MKKIYILLLLVFPFLLQSCLKEEEDIFGKDPSIRVEEALKNYKEVLAAAENGWLLEYYAESNQKYGGYNFALKFSTSEVTAYFELADPSESVTSMYQLISDDGPVLSFDTYNIFLHYFSNPSEDLPDAREGDYEFILQGISDDQTEIKLKGKKTGNRMVLKRLTETPEDYLNKVIEIQKASKAPKYSMEVAGTIIDCSLAGNVLSYQYSGEDSQIVSGNVAFCYTDTGIRLYEKTEIKGATFRDFTYADDQFNAIGADASINLIFLPVNQQFVMGDWFIAYSQLGEYAKPYYNVVKQAEDELGEVLQYAFIGSMLYDKFGFNFISSGYGGLLGLDYELIGENKISLVFNSTGEGDGVWYHNNAGFANALVPFGYSKPRVFTLETDNLRSPSYVILTEDANPVNKIKLFAQQISNPFNK